MSKPLSRSRALIAQMYEVSLRALAKAPGGELSKASLLDAIERGVALDEWAREIYPHNGNIRWRSIFGFSSVGLVKAGYVTKSGGRWAVTEEGRHAISGPFDAVKFLAIVRDRYKIWERTQVQSSGDFEPAESGEAEDADALEAPDERMSTILKSAHQALAAELVEAIKQCEPAFFENLVVKLLLKMGYGGSREEAGRAVGRSGDGGIDGIINEDRLGLDAIYLQAKRWANSVGEAEIRDFKGALDAKNAHKGVFITTSHFTPAAITAARNSRSYKIVLIDGARLAELMIEHDLGVTVTSTYQLKRLDADYFTEA